MIEISGIWQTPLRIEDVFVYIGTMLIGFEFIRKINRFEVILMLIFFWPISPVVNAIPTTPAQKARFRWNRIIRSLSKTKIVYSIILLLIFWPLSLVSLTIFIFTELIKAIDKLLNLAWNCLITRYETFSRKMVGFLIQNIKRYRGLSSRAVVRRMKEEQIPFIPIFGIILIIIALFMYVF
jgi:hypothetical protein